jgi:hypothetical protein
LRQDGIFEEKIGITWAMENKIIQKIGMLDKEMHHLENGGYVGLPYFDSVGRRFEFFRLDHIN